MDKESCSPFSQISGSILLVTFVTLCLSVLAFFALSSAREEGRLSTGSVQSMSAYYTADAQAEGTIARIRAGELPEGVTQNGDIYSFSHPIGTTQMLMVKVQLSEGDCIILRWQPISLDEWAAEQKQTP